MTMTGGDNDDCTCGFGARILDAIENTYHIFGAAEIRLELEDAFGQNIYR